MRREERTPAVQALSVDDAASGGESSALPGTTADRIRALALKHAGALPQRQGRVPDLGLAVLRHRFERLYSNLPGAARGRRTGSRAEEWLLDNRHVVEQTLEAIGRDIPPGYLRRLPRLESGDQSPGAVRVQELARFVLDEGDVPLDMGWIEHAVDLYQSTTVLTIGELWALPALLRLAILDKLVGDARRCLERVESLRADGLPEDRIVQEIPSDDVAGDIVSLRHLDAHDWRESFEGLSRVDRVLRRDPAGAFARLDFASRDRYRGAIEDLARTTCVCNSEVEVAGMIVDMCREPDVDDHRTRHVGYYLVSGGRSAAERKLGCRVSVGRRIVRRLFAIPELVYFTLLLGMAVVPMAFFAGYLLWQGASPPATALIALVAAVPVVGLAVAMVNGLLTWLLAPRRLSRLDFDKGIPREYRTAVVMPVLLAGDEDVDHALQRIEINYLNNHDRQLVYALLSDWADAPRASMPGDDVVLERAAAGIKELNHRYGRGPERGPFLLLHRKRLWNGAEGCWMGWERKRGKLAEFNRLLGGHSDTSYTTSLGDRAALAGVEFVITLDADTHLPPGAARALVGTIAHPLNRAVIDPRKGTIKAGYSILQPRLEIDPDSTQSTRFTEIFAGDTTLDLYTHAASDVYHDLFAEGIYAGKGLYDWRAFEHTLQRRIPENALLSHDLLEGVHGRVALVSDIVMLEQYPTNALAYMRRLHRWVRGDWQLLPWLAPLVPSATGAWFRNPLSLVHQWKILDNLRRSLQPPAVLVLLILAWLGMLPGSAWLWTLLFAAFLAAPLITWVFDFCGRSLAHPGTLPQRVRDMPHLLGDRLAHWALSLVLLPFESYVVLDAIGRTLSRLFVTRRRLLEWTAAAHVHRRLGSVNSRSLIWREMWIAPVLAVAAAAAVAGAQPAALAAAAPLLLAWLAAPPIIWWVNRPLHAPPLPLSPGEHRRLRGIARRTWLFFEQFVEPDNHWLPPDNFQEEPRVALARRTSPTNIGMALASALSAYDFGYIDASALAARIRNTCDGMAHLRRHRGHWLNWYETRDLRPLQPEYVSTVDSGNLAACLMVVARGMQEIIESPVQRSPLTRGVADTVGVLLESLERIDRGSGAPPAELMKRLRAIRRRLLAARSPADQLRCVTRLQEGEVDAFTDQLLAWVEDGQVTLDRDELSELRTWLEELVRQLRRARRSLHELQPWLAAFEDVPACYAEAGPDSPIGRGYRKLRTMLTGEIPLRELPGRCRDAVDCLDELVDRSGGAEVPLAERRYMSDWNEELRANLVHAAAVAEHLLEELTGIALLADTWVAEMDFGFLYDENRHLFRIGYNVTNGTLDPNYYDLLASEARLAGFVAIAKGDAPARHWLHLGRPFRRAGRSTVLMSWGATLFEYLMPGLFLSTPHDTLMNRACRSAIGIHQDFTRRRKLPWGISESGYYELDEAQHYQYRAFGVPGLGFRRDLGDRLVVAPYASVMALPFEPRAVLENLTGLEAVRARGRYGLYEAVDFGRTDKNVPRRARVVRSYMSHHQGMALLAIDNFLNGDAMVRRFHRDPRVARIAMLLHEQLPRVPPALKTLERPDSTRYFSARPAVAVRPLQVDDDAVRRFGLLSNGRYTLALNAAGGGGSCWDGVALTGWRFDPTRNDAGHWVYVKDLDNGDLVSIGRDPVGDEAGSCSVHAGPHVVQYQRRGGGFFCQMDIAVSSQHDVEVRKVTVRNEERGRRHLLIADFAEIAMAPVDEFRRHPAFARLFVESECLEEERTLLFRRRPRSSLEKPLYLAHAVVTPAVVHSRFGWETERAAGLGRCGRLDRPAMLQDGLGELRGTTGAVLDPVMAAGVELRLAPNESVELAFLTAVRRSRTEVLSILRSYRSMPRVDWVFEQARMQSEQEMYNLQVDPGEMGQVTDVLSALLAPRRALRGSAGFDAPGEALQSLLWSRGISGDRPLILLWVRQGADMPVVEQVLRIHTWICGRQAPADLLLIDEESTGYTQPTRDRLEHAIAEIRSRTHRRLAGAVFIVPGKELSAEVRNGLAAAAHLVLDTRGGALLDQLARRTGVPAPLPPFVPVKSAEWQSLSAEPLSRPDDLLHDNGLGGFSADGSEYVIHLESDDRPPAPWSNIVANSGFGCLLTESGTCCTWAGNSSEHRLTPWPNDPVADRSGEVVYLRDEETGRVWTPTPQPMSDGGPYQVRYGAGYAEYRHNGPALRESCRIHVDSEAPVKVCRLSLTNTAAWTRRITATYYAEWVLGTTRADTTPYIRSGFDYESSALLARNVFDRLAGAGVAFLAASRPPHGMTADRGEFLGRGGDTGAPAALYRIGLSGDVRGGDDPCAAYQVHVDLAPGETQTLYFVLGLGAGRAEAVSLARRFRDPGEAESSFDRVRGKWEELLAAVRVQTPEPAMDLLMNRWLLYQVLASRLWGRTGYYQSSGAYGFRDQLQDVTALSIAAPELAREHILRAAGRQFQEGDVLHWWHEAPLRGVRTRCSDDLLWLPFVTGHYVARTGDDAVLRERVAYLAGPRLQRDESERYAEFPESDEHGSLYEHCCRAIERAAVVGPHGLPTIGSGDWNDGFNRISTTGRGESVWLAWFLARVCDDFAPVCEAYGDPALAARLRELAGDMRECIEREAWDGEWYRRAYCDDGTPVGSTDSEECQIDLIAQAWSVMGADAPTDRARQAMQSARDRLVRPHDRLVLLLSPPFDQGKSDPGYIKGYPPGIRENGGQYTHAATWAVWAAAGLGDGDGAMELFRLLNPILRARDPDAVGRYRVEPYVLAGDVYGVPPHAGRGGWTWYSGAAAWMYRAGLEALLGLKRRGDAMEVEPCLPADWPGYRAQIRRGSASYEIELRKPRGLMRGRVDIIFDGARCPGNRFPFVDDNDEHVVQVELNAMPAQAAAVTD